MRSLYFYKNYGNDQIVPAVAGKIFYVGRVIGYDEEPISATATTLN